MSRQGYVSTDCRVGAHEDCADRRIVPDCRCGCHDERGPGRGRPTGPPR